MFLATTSSTNSEEYKPPLPEKSRNSDYGNLPIDLQRASNNSSFGPPSVTSRPLPELPPDAHVNNSVYDFVEIRNPNLKMKSPPPVPPPKPSRQAKASAPQNA